MSTKKKKTKEEMLDEIFGPDEESAKQKEAEDWYNSEVEPANPLDNAELIDQIEYGLYAMVADASMLMRMLDRLRDEQRAHRGECDK
tara:strand:- start:5 stop:265 length:261 start_codon:yes stop_codon:yes gene_type:complete